MQARAKLQDAKAPNQRATAPRPHSQTTQPTNTLLPVAIPSAAIASVSPQPGEAPLTIAMLPAEVTEALNRFLTSFEAAIKNPEVDPRQFVRGLSKCLHSAHRQLVPSALHAIEAAFCALKPNPRLCEAFTTALEGAGVLDLFETWQRRLPTDHGVYQLTQRIIKDHMDVASEEWIYPKAG